MLTGAARSSEPRVSEPRVVSKHDVIIVGAGPAGAVAALVLARAGARVRVLDRARFPRFKLCGDSVNPGALDLLARLGLAAIVDGGVPVDGMVVTSQSGAGCGPWLARDS